MENHASVLAWPMPMQNAEPPTIVAGVVANAEPLTVVAGAVVTTTTTTTEEVANAEPPTIVAGAVESAEPRTIVAEAVASAEPRTIVAEAVASAEPLTIVAGDSLASTSLNLQDFHNPGRSRELLEAGDEGVRSPAHNDADLGMLSLCPRLIPDAFLTHKDGKYLFLNPSIPNWIVVNQSAAYLLGMCDGRRSIAEILGELESEGHEIDIAGTMRLFNHALDQQILNTQVECDCPSGEYDNCGQPKRVHSIHLKLTNKCNLRCSYCFARSDPSASSDSLSLNQLKCIADQVSELSSTVAYTLSGGEPLLHPGALDFAEYVTRLGNRCSLLTNGLPVNKKNAAKIANLFRLVKISLDGSSEEINSKTRGPGSFRPALKAFNLLKEQNANVFISMTVSNSNLSDVQNMVEMFGSRLNFQPLFKAGREQDVTGREITGEEYYRALDSCDGVKPMARIESKLARLRGRGAQKCPFADGEISISELGDVYPCQMLHEDRFCAGNIKEKSLADIYANSPVFSSLRKMTVENVEGCSNCPIRRLCGGSCRARSYYETGDISIAGDFCDYEKLAYLNGILDSSELVQIT